MKLEGAESPAFDLLDLGMGDDGHTASLFPGTRVTKQTSRWVSTPMVTKLNARRMTLTLPVLDASRRVLFLVAGADKAEMVHAVLQTKPETTEIIGCPMLARASAAKAHCRRQLLRVHSPTVVENPDP